MPHTRPTILVPVDFEGTSPTVLETARWLAEPLDASICLMHVHDRPTFDHPVLPAEMVIRMQGLIEQAAQKSLAELAAQQGAAQTVFRHGDPAAEILKVAAELHPAMVVMGTHGRQGASRIFLGSVAEHVVRACAVPVVTVRTKAAA